MTIQTNRICTTQHQSWWTAQTPLRFWHTNEPPNLNQKTRPYNNQQKNEDMQNCGLCCTGWPQSTIERKWKEGKIPRPYSGIEETEDDENDVYTYWNWWFWYCHQKISKRTGGLGNKWTSADHPNYCIFEISQNTEKSHGDLRWFAVTQIPVKDHQLILMRKTLKQ